MSMALVRRANVLSKLITKDIEYLQKNKWLKADETNKINNRMLLRSQEIDYLSSVYIHDITIQDNMYSSVPNKRT